MQRTLVYIFLSIFSVFLSYGQASVNPKSKKLSFVRYPAYKDSLTSVLHLRNQEATFGRKMLRAEGFVLGFQSATIGLLFALPEGVSSWDKDNVKKFGANIKRAFSSAPVIDYDNWYINYLGHPYQGAYYYNSVRSQGAKVWQAALFSLTQSMLWEYTLEAGIEQPSIQDIIVTPIAGSLLGELFHFSTQKMSKNGFRWYEKAFIVVFNPMYAVNNGFRFAAIKKEF